MKAWAVTWRAHPRSRGEHANSSTTKKFRRGSSPLARGTQEIIEDDKYCLGLIPARAGNTGYGFCGADHAWAHPRSRGEHHVFFAVDKPNPGSSPLARGTRGFSRATAGGGGLIPARAGNTEWLTDWLQTGEAHPRSRGEHT